ncbi:hypothetical protein P9VFCI_114 [Rhizobium phage P9VFCI]|uniref:Uncharacterized protein n=1 Tax=Rhizobium phage P9VFCI TaxID=2763531 RepID=A0A7G7WX97_9CAUD|nr:hypothetical protein PP937_gp114 [Rhizobium phage P9VFCI]QNH71841.1 hypothetical protein P9VFCI_114 [Rhizobium phage P9VFCI]
MTKKVRVLVVEGVDRSGKDTLVRKLGENAIHQFKHNNLETNLHREYYGITRSNMKSDNAEFVSRLTKSMAIVEFMQLLAFIKRYHFEHDMFSVARLFPSTVVYDAVRGIKPDFSLKSDLLRIKLRFEQENDIEIDMRLLTLFVNAAVMIERGSTTDSFEIKNYHRIEHEFEEYTMNEISYPIMFNKSKMLNVTTLSMDEIVTLAENFLFQS